MIRTRKPRNAASKRALEARAPREIEDEKTVIFVKGTHVGERVSGVMKDLMALKRPHAIAFSKKNEIRPFEDSSSLDFWAGKNDAAMFAIGQSTKKRPDGLTLVRMFDGSVLDMCELGVTAYTPMNAFPGSKSTPGHKPLVQFASQLFDTHPRYIQLRSLLLDLFGASQIDAIHLAGIEHVICISTAPVPPSLTSTSASADPNENTPLPTIHIRTYTTRLLASGVRVPRVELTPMGPSLDLVLRRHQEADPAVWNLAMKVPKLKKKDVESGLGKKRKNIDVDEMGDVRGRVHVARQDLGKLQTRKMRGLKRARGDAEEDE
ncbi:rRNA-binding ribosome biosynthesis protein rpf2 [Ceratobasidium sp. 394]|nr:rRNA-binding ribosome biosynthesis protein rpf2 [Ceratobasidium sp. 394]KAG9099332.1 rRNA-binding ribosome biosynthesis protein rpf2 [Ceratobasidium sp. UAMH 11750]